MDLVGVVLVARSSSEGTRVVFRYPSPTPMVDTPAQQHIYSSADTKLIMRDVAVHEEVRGAVAPAPSPRTSGSSINVTAPQPATNVIQREESPQLVEAPEQPEDTQRITVVVPVPVSPKLCSIPPDTKIPSLSSGLSQSSLMPPPLTTPAPALPPLPAPVVSPPLPPPAAPVLDMGRNKPPTPLPAVSQSPSLTATSIPPAPTPSLVISTPTPSITPAHIPAVTSPIPDIKFSSSNMLAATSTLALALTPKPVMCDHSFTLSVGDIVFLGHPTTVQASSTYNKYISQSYDSANSTLFSTVKSEDSSATVTTMDHDIDFFHIAFVVSKGPDIHNVRPRLHEASSRLSAALKHEELRCRYVSLQVSKLLHVRQRFHNEIQMLAQQQPRPSLNIYQLLERYEHLPTCAMDFQFFNQSLHDLTSASSAVTQLQAKHITEDFMTDLLQTSSLASEIKSIFEDFCLSGVAHLVVNNWINVSLSLWDPTPAALRPYHTLLVTDRTLINRRLSAEVRVLVSHSSPFKSFGELQLETGISLNHLYHIANHLVYWRCALVMDVIRLSNIYTLNTSMACPIIRSTTSVKERFQSSYLEGSPIHEISTTLHERFVSDCTGFSLRGLLNRFSTEKPLREHIKEILQESAASKATSTHSQAQSWQSSSKFTASPATSPSILATPPPHHSILRASSPVHLATPSPAPVNSQNPSLLISLPNPTPTAASSTSITTDSQSVLPGHSVNSRGFLQAVVWLITHNLISQIHPYPYLMDLPPPSLFSDGPYVASLWNRIQPYLTGEHTTDEIRWRENVSKEDLNEIIKRGTGQAYYSPTEYIPTNMGTLQLSDEDIATIVVLVASHEIDKARAANLACESLAVVGQTTDNAPEDVGHASGVSCMYGMSLLSKQWARVCSSPAVWRQLYGQMFGDPLDGVAMLVEWRKVYYYSLCEAREVIKRKRRQVQDMLTHAGCHLLL
ncbi:Nitrogen permease regulator 3 protein [Pelomyxa schiedti]|nr:Nitrogen permease regulator 3 protein [Pelomyxa schiedti]